jgi:hypothetical protein
VSVEDLPEGHHGVCGPGCVDIARSSSDSARGIREGEKYRAIVLEDVQGETVTTNFGGPPPSSTSSCPRRRSAGQLECTGK